MILTSTTTLLNEDGQMVGVTFLDLNLESLGKLTKQTTG